MGVADPQSFVDVIQFSNEIRVAEEGQPYVKNQRYVEPNALRTFAVGESNVYWYFEIYNLEGEAETEDSQYVARFYLISNFL